MGQKSKKKKLGKELFDSILFCISLSIPILISISCEWQGSAA